MTASVLFIARLVVGLGMTAHGAQKAFGWFGGRGLKGTGGFLESLGYRPGEVYAVLAAGSELAGGLLTGAGFLGPVGPALIILVMIVASGTIHVKNGFFSQKNGFELNAIYVAASLAMAFGGSSEFTLDAALGMSGYFTEGVVASTILVGIMIGSVTLGLRRATGVSASH
jgi:putative oxidoreductase